MCIMPAGVVDCAVEDVEWLALLLRALLLPVADE